MEKSTICMDNLCFDPLTKQENISALALCSGIVRTCIGPNGKLKLIRNSSGGHTTVTSSSSRIFQSLSVKNHFNRMIVSAAKSHLRRYNDGGLLCAFFPLSLIEQSSHCDIHSSLKAKLYEYFLQMYIHCLNSEENLCVSRINPSNLQHLKAVVRTIISSKLECLLSCAQRGHLCELLIEVFLNIFQLPCRSNFRFVTLEGCDTRQSRLLNGLYVQVPKTEWEMFNCTQQAKVALLTDAALTTEIVSKLTSADVVIVFCQKVVDPCLKKQLMDASITVFDQLGSETTSCLRYLLGDCVNITFYNSVFYVNTINCLKEKIGRKHYIVLQGKQLCFYSILICNYNQEFLLEMKVVCEQIISALFCLLQNPKVCFGAGCTEIFSALLLTKKIRSELNRKMFAEFGCTDEKIMSTLNYFILSLIDLAVSSHQQPPLNFAFDTKFGHLWNQSNSSQKSCCCGSISSAEELLQLHSLSNHSSLPFEKPTFQDYHIIDELSCKVNAVRNGGEAAISLLKTHLCIFTGTV